MSLSGLVISYIVPLGPVFFWRTGSVIPMPEPEGDPKLNSTRPSASAPRIRVAGTAHLQAGGDAVHHTAQLQRLQLKDHICLLRLGNLLE